MSQKVMTPFLHYCSDRDRKINHFKAMIGFRKIKREKDKYDINSLYYLLTNCFAL